jgi:hypothetical protein
MGKAVIETKMQFNKKFYSFNGDYIHCALIYSSLLLKFHMEVQEA